MPRTRPPYPPELRREAELLRDAVALVSGNAGPTPDSFITATGGGQYVSLSFGQRCR